jgi:hypothetical protein
MSFSLEMGLGAFEVLERRGKYLQVHPIGLIYTTQYLRVPLIIVSVITIIIMLVS